jgi:hypothetical protein
VRAERLKLAPEKMKCIRSLAWDEREGPQRTFSAWRSPNRVCLRLQRLLPISVSGPCGRKPGQPGEAGIITDFLGGKAGLAEENAALETFRSGLAKMSPKMAESLDPDPKAVTSFFWSRYPYTRQLRRRRTIHHDVGRAPSPLLVAGQFAGEHTAATLVHEQGRPGEPGRRHLVETLALKGGAAPHGKGGEGELTLDLWGRMGPRARVPWFYGA